MKMTGLQLMDLHKSKILEDRILKRKRMEDFRGIIIDTNVNKTEPDPEHLNKLFSEKRLFMGYIYKNMLRENIPIKIISYELDDVFLESIYDMVTEYFHKRKYIIPSFFIFRCIFFNFLKKNIGIKVREMRDRYFMEKHIRENVVAPSIVGKRRRAKEWLDKTKSNPKKFQEYKDRINRYRRARRKMIKDGTWLGKRRD